MGIFNDFNKKEKPVFTGSRFGFGSGGSGGSAAASFSASGGTTTTYTDSGVTYKSHTFDASHASSSNPGSAPHTFVVTSGSALCDIMMCGGGGAGGDGNAASGGGGGGQVNIATSVPMTSTGGPGSNGTYPISVGRGGKRHTYTGGQGGNDNPGNQGNDTTLYVDAISGNVTAAGGGGGGGYNQGPGPGSQKGSGGGGAGPQTPLNGYEKVLAPLPGSLVGTWNAYGSPGAKSRNKDDTSPYPSPFTNAGTIFGGGGGGAGEDPAAPDGPTTGATWSHVTPQPYGNGNRGGAGLGNNFRTGSTEYYGAGGGGGAWPSTASFAYGGRQGTDSASNYENITWGLSGADASPASSYGHPGGNSPAEPGFYPIGSTDAMRHGTPGQPGYGSGGGGTTDRVAGAGGSGRVVIRYVVG